MRNRHPAGTPLGGRFAAGSNPESDVELGAQAAETERVPPGGLLDSYRDNGFEKAEAVAWYSLNFYPGEARAWCDAGFDPDSAGEWHDGGIYIPSNAAAWRNVGCQNPLRARDLERDGVSPHEMKEPQTCAVLGAERFEPYTTGGSPTRPVPTTVAAVRWPEGEVEIALVDTGEGWEEARRVRRHNRGLSGWKMDPWDRTRIPEHEQPSGVVEAKVYLAARYDDACGRAAHRLATTTEQ